jgi:hypothetical protein
MNHSTIDLNKPQILDRSASVEVAHQELGNACRQQIYAACIRQSNLREHSTSPLDEKGSVANLLYQCEWSINSHANTNTLAIQCPNLNSNLLVLEKVMQFGSLLKQLAIGKVRFSSDGETSLEIGVDEISVDRD